MERWFPVLLLLCFGWSSFAQEKPAAGMRQGQDTSAQPPLDSPPAPDAPDASDTQITQAETAILKGDLKTAETLLDSFLVAHPNDPRALFDAGYLADTQGRNDDALALYKRTLDANPRSFEAELSMGLLQARLSKPADAYTSLKAAVSMDPGDAGLAAKSRSWRALARIDLNGYSGKLPDTAEASNDLIEALKISPETIDDTLLAASIAEAAKDPASAESAYRRALKAQPDSGAAQAGLAHLLIQQKKYPEAEELLKGALIKAPDDAALTAQLAAVMVAEDKADALPLLQQFHAKHADQIVITRMLAKVLADGGQYAESDQIYVQLLAASPRDADLLSGHGQNLIRLRRYPEAVTEFSLATASDPANGDAWNGLAFASFQTHQPALTLQALQARSKYLPENATIYFLYATAYDTLHEKKQAASYYHRFLESSAGKLPDQEWQARQRLAVIEKTP